MSPEQTIEQRLVRFGSNQEEDGMSVTLPGHPPVACGKPASGIPATLGWGWADHHLNGADEWFVALEELA
jgi:hypothetical protein